MSAYFERIEQHLTDAVDRHARTPSSQRRPQTRPNRQRTGRSRVRGAVAPIASIAVVVIVAATFLHTARIGVPRVAPATRPTQQPTIEHELVGALGVLRAPQTPADRAFNQSRIITDIERHSRINPALTRIVHLRHEILVGLYLTTRLGGGGPGGLGIFERQHHDGFGECCITAAMLRGPTTPGPLASSNAPHPHQVYVEIVPDGVARVRWVFARRSPGYGPFPHPLKITVAVHKNVAATNLPDRGPARTVDWYDARGRIVASRTTR